MTILIGGGTGFFGKALVHSLRSKGHQVSVITRNPRGKDQIKWDDISRNGLPDGTKAVVNLSGRNILEMSPLLYTKKHHDAFIKDVFKSRLETNKLLTEAIRSAHKPIDVFISASAVGFYKTDPVKAYTEEDPFVDYSYLGTLCKQWEESAKMPDRANIRQIQVRIGLILGRGGGVIQSMYLPFIMGVGGRVGSGQQWYPWIHMDDIVGIFEHALFEKVPSGPMNGTAPNPVTNAEFTKALSQALRRPAIFPMPSFMVRTIFQDRAILLLEGQKVLPKRALDAGYKFKYTDVYAACKSLF